MFLFVSHGRLTGLVFDESVGPDMTLDASQTKPKVRLMEDPKHSKVHIHMHVHLHSTYTLFITLLPTKLILASHPCRDYPSTTHRSSKS